MAAQTRPSLIAQGSPTSLAVMLPAAVAVAILVASVFAPSLVVEASRADFYLVTVFLGGGAAWLSGRAVASVWRLPVSLMGLNVAGWTHIIPV